MVKKKRKNSTVSPFCYSVEVHYSDTSDYEQLLSLQIEGKFIVFTGLLRTLFPFFQKRKTKEIATVLFLQKKLLSLLSGWHLRLMIKLYIHLDATSSRATYHSKRPHPAAVKSCIYIFIFTVSTFHLQVFLRSSLPRGFRTSVSLFLILGVYSGGGRGGRDPPGAAVHLLP